MPRVHEHLCSAIFKPPYKQPKTRQTLHSASQCDQTLGPTPALEHQSRPKVLLVAAGFATMSIRQLRLIWCHMCCVNRLRSAHMKSGLFRKVLLAIPVP